MVRSIMMGQEHRDRTGVWWWDRSMVPGQQTQTEHTSDQTSPRHSRSSPLPVGDHQSPHPTALQPPPHGRAAPPTPLPSAPSSGGGDEGGASAGAGPFPPPLSAL